MKFNSLNLMALESHWEVLDVGTQCNLKKLTQKKEYVNIHYNLTLKVQRTNLHRKTNSVY